MMPSPLRLEVAAINASPFPISLALIKQHCAVDGSDSDTLLMSHALAAIKWAEGVAHRTFVRRSHRWVVNRFPAGCLPLYLPRGKTQSVESVSFVQNGATVTLKGPSSAPAGADFQEDLHGDDGGALMPLRGQAWPCVDRDAISPVVINFTAGYGLGQIPEDALHAMLFATSDAYDTRGSADLTVFGRNFTTRELLISGFALERF
jgi:uncharacterized phiE125 gp8 family phage protein